MKVYVFMCVSEWEQKHRWITQFDTLLPLCRIILFGSSDTDTVRNGAFRNVLSSPFYQTLATFVLNLFSGLLLYNDVMHWSLVWLRLE